VRNQWGRDESYRWPSHKPVWTITALLLGIAVMLGAAMYQVEVRWTLLERYWFPGYARMQFLGWLGLRTSEYRLLEVEDRKGQKRLAIDRDVAPWEGELPRGYTVPLTLSDEAGRQNLRLVLEPKESYKNKELAEYIRHWIYQDESFGDFMRWPLIWGAAFFVWMMGAGGPQRP
jgi:hypothetical protein